MTATARAQRAQRSPLANPEAAPAVAEAPAAAPAPEPATGPARPARRPFGSRRQRLDNTPIPGFQCRWINDTPGRIDDAKVSGWEHVTDSEGRPAKLVVGVAEGGGPLVAYRMKIPREWYEEDQLAKEEPRRALDQQMRQGIKDAGYASEGRPGYTSSRIEAEMTQSGRQSFGSAKAAADKAAEGSR